MIQIIAGTFGYYNGRKVVPITNADGPQKFDPSSRPVWSSRASPSTSTSSPWPLPRPQSRSRSPRLHPRPTTRPPLLSTTRT